MPVNKETKPNLNSRENIKKNSNTNKKNIKTAKNKKNNNPTTVSLSLIHTYRCPRGAMVKTLDCSIVVNEF